MYKSAELNAYSFVVKLGSWAYFSTSFLISLMLLPRSLGRESKINEGFVNMSAVGACEAASFTFQCQLKGSPSYFLQQAFSILCNLFHLLFISID